MINFFYHESAMHVSDSIINNSDETKIKTYILSYIKELQRHFDVTDDIMLEIIKKVYKQLSPKGFIQKTISMIKSFYNQKRNK